MAYNLSAFAGAGAQFFTDNGDPLTGGLLYVYAAGTTTPSTTWTTNSGAVANTNPIVLDAAGRTPNEIWLNSGATYKFILKTSTGVLVGTYDNIPAIDDPTVFNNLITVTGTNTLIGTSVPAYTAYVAGMTLSFIPVATNTGAVTIDVDGLGAKNIYAGSSTPLIGGEFVVGRIVQVEYDGTRFQLYQTSVSIPDGAVTTAKLADGAATGVKLGSDVVKTTGTQTIGGAKTFTSNIIFNDASQQGTAYTGQQYQVFSTSGTFTVPAGITSVIVQIYPGGGGGKGGGPNLGGNSGGTGFASAIVTVTPGASIAVTVGGGGNGSAGSTGAPANGTTGGTSSFGALVSVTGGGGGGTGATSAVTTSALRGTLVVASGANASSSGGSAAIGCNTYPGGGSGGSGWSGGGGGGGSFVSTSGGVGGTVNNSTFNQTAGTNGSNGTATQPGAGGAGGNNAGGSTGGTGGAGGGGVNSAGGGGGGGGAGAVIVSW